MPGSQGEATLLNVSYVRDPYADFCWHGRGEADSQGETPLWYVFQFDCLVVYSSLLRYISSSELPREAKLSSVLPAKSSLRRVACEFPKGSYSSGGLMRSPGEVLGGLRHLEAKMRPPSCILEVSNTTSVQTMHPPQREHGLFCGRLAPNARAPYIYIYMCIYIYIYLCVYSTVWANKAPLTPRPLD